MRKSCLLFCGAALFLAGCGGPAVHTVQAAPAVPAGWVAAASRDGSVSVAVPGGWRSGADRMMDSSMGGMMGDAANNSQPAQDSQMSAELSKMTAQLEKDDKAQEEKELAAMEAKGTILNVINSSKPIPGEARTRFYVHRYAGDGNANWDEAVAREKDHYLHNQTPKLVQLPIGKAYRFQGDEELKDGGVIHQISYIVLEGKNGYSLRFITEEQPTVIDSIADQVAQTWRVKA